MSFDPPARIVTLDRNYRSTQPILAASNAVIGLAPRALRQGSLDRARRRREAGAGHRRRGGRSGALRRRRACWRTARPATTLKSQAVLFRTSSPQRRARTRADAAQHPVRQVRRPEISRRRAYQGHARAAAFRRESARPRRRLPRRAIAAGHRPGERGQDRRRGGGGRRASRRSPPSRRPPRRARPSANSSNCSSACATARPGRSIWARRSPGGATISRMSTTMSRPARPISTRSSASPRPIPRANVSSAT